MIEDPQCCLVCDECGACEVIDLEETSADPPKWKLPDDLPEGWTIRYCPDCSASDDEEYVNDVDYFEDEEEDY